MRLGRPWGRVKIGKVAVDLLPRMVCTKATGPGNAFDTALPPLDFCNLMIPSVYLEGSTCVATRHNLPQVGWKECFDGASLFVLMDMPEFVRQQALGFMTSTDQYGVPESEPIHFWTKQSCLQCSLS